MGYTTDFEGAFTISPPLSDLEAADLEAFSDDRHGGNMQSDPGMPGFWCQWGPSQSGWLPEDERGEDYAPVWDRIEWDGGEKFYDYVEWIQYLIDNRFAPAGHVLNGSVTWQGEESDDMGQIVITDNVVRTRHAEVRYVDN